MGSEGRSLAFANNKGGSGKTFMLYQAACEAARAAPSRKVLVVDLSLYSDTSALLMGGLSREHTLAGTAGLVNTVAATDPDHRAEGLVRDLVAAAAAAAPLTAAAAAAAPAPSLFGRFFTARAPAPAATPPPPLDLLRCAPSPLVALFLSPE
jgi:Mrp family chromosome partitioning ATPase